VVSGRRETSVILLVVGALLFYGVFLLSTPSNAQTNGDTNDGNTSNEGCDDPDEVAFFDGTENRRTGEFEITGDTFRLTYDATVIDPDEFAAFSIDVLDEDGRLVDFTPVVEDDDEDSINVLEGPGRFRLEIDSENFEYAIAVDDCAGTDQDDEDTNDGDRNDRDRDEVDRDQEDLGEEDRTDEDRVDGDRNDQGRNAPSRTREPANVIRKTIPKKPLPPTGGLPVSTVVAGLVLTGAGLLALGLGVRRGRRR